MRPSGPVLLALLVLASTATAGSVGAASAPSIAMTLGGSTVGDGDQIILGSDPVLQLNVSADAALETVVVRVDGGTVHSASPDARTYHVELPLDLPTGDSDVKVIAKDTAGGVTSSTVHVLKDNRRPVVHFSAPFETTGGDPPDNTTVTDGYVTVAGEIVDHTAVSRVVITRRNIYRFAGREEVDRKVYRITDPGESFSQRVFLGNQSNDLTVKLTDAMGNQRVYETTIEFNDSEAPTVTLDEIPQQPPAPVIELDGMVEDNGQLDVVTLTVEGQFQDLTLLSPVGPEPDETRTAFDIERTVDLTEGTHDVIVTARDLAGNEASYETAVIYEETIVPRITVDRDATGFEGDGSIAVRGAVEHGKVTAVSVETIAAGSGETADIVQVYSGDVTESVPVDATLSTADGRTTVVVRATDSEGNEHTETFLVDPATETLFVGERTTETATPSIESPTVTPATPATGTPANSTATPTNGTQTPTPSQTEADPGTESGSGESEGGVVELLTSLPGFGVLPAVLALLLVVLLARRRG